MISFQRTGREERLYIGPTADPLGQLVTISGRGAALTLVRDLARDAWGLAALRRLYAEVVGRASITKESDRAVLDALALRLTTGQLKVWTRALPKLEMPRITQEAPPAPPLPIAAAPPPPDDAPEPDELLADIEADPQAKALEQAAKDGKPFCEECAKAAEDPPLPEPDEMLSAIEGALQAERLTEAADEGLPFCAICERRKKDAA